MKITIINPVNFKERHISRLKEFGDIAYCDIKPDPYALKHAQILVSPSIHLPETILSKFENLKLISLVATGYNRIDLKAAAKLDIAVTNVPCYATDSVAEHTFSLLLALLKNLQNSKKIIGKYKDIWRYYINNEENNTTHSILLKGMVFGVIGTGSIGKRVAEIARAFGCDVIAHTLHPKQDSSIRYMDLDPLLAASDIISLHAPITSLSSGMISYYEFSKMKKMPVLLNTARRGLIDHSALIAALKEEKISAAGLDVYEPAYRAALKKFPNVILSPHIASHTPEALETRADIAVDNIEAFIKGHPANLLTDT